MKYGRLLLFPLVAGLAASVGVPDQVGLPGPAVLTGCFRDDCSGTDGGTVFAEQGHMIDENTWESAPQNGTWQEFFGGQFHFFYAPFGGRVPYDQRVYVSVSPNPLNGDGNSISEAAGNIALINNIGPNQIAVTNGTCSKYYVRVVLFAAPFPPAPPADLDAGASDASEPEGDAGDPTDPTDAADDDAGD